MSLRPRGRSGLKLHSDFSSPQVLGLRPRGRSGLKLLCLLLRIINKWSPSSRAEWVEISTN